MEIIIGLALVPVVAIVAFLVWSATDAGRKRSRGHSTEVQEDRATKSAARRGDLTNDTAAPQVEQ